MIGLNLCPFANAVESRRQVRYVVTDASTPEDLRQILCDEIRRLITSDPEIVETTLLIHPKTLTAFLPFNDFLTIADAAVAEVAGTGVLQLASFHPLYQFAGTAIGDVSNATNRSPYPTLHLLREKSVSRALATFPNPDTIFEDNVRTLNALGTTGWAALQAECRQDVDTAVTRLAVPPADA